MVKYYYDKYNAETTYVYHEDYSWYPESVHDMHPSTYPTYADYKFDTATGTYSGVGSPTTLTRNSPNFIGRYCFGPTARVKFQITGNTLDWSISSADGQIRVNAKHMMTRTETRYTRGTIVQSDISAEDGTYPTNGRHSDGFWYVRKSMVNTAPTYTQIPAQTVKKNTTATVTLANYFSDAEGNTLTFTASSNNTNVATVSIASGKLTVTGKAIGTATITVTATDGSLSTSQAFSMTVANTAPSYTQIPGQTTKKSVSITLNLNNYFSDVDNDALSYSATSSNAGIATVGVASNILTITGQAIGNATITVTASDGKSTATQSFAVAITNAAPTVTVSQPSANVTLYENDLLQLAGSASDVDANQSITIYAQVNNEQRIVLNVGLSNAPVSFNKQLKFVGGKLYDDDTVITGNLIDSIPHTLKIWAQDGDGALSTITERAFYVVPNRPPILTIDTVQPSGIIDTDKFVISGTANDPDNNSVTASYRLNGGNSVALEITEGRWAFEIALGQLDVGQNTIVIELVDSYNFKVSKTIKLNKTEVKTPILHSVARYKIEPPRGSAKGVLLWIQRDEELNLIAELSMTLQGEQEQYVKLTADHTAPVSTGVVEDEFYFEANEPKNNIILKLSTTRPNIDVNHKIHLISGVLE
ncbi:Ig-like domain-containing protein [Bacillus ndiopicus]|uniref:Ig-like domain-containing protein n=1 Tax=Bacillus ndiopicus TaxID=1347368 RepID=UPI0006946A1E|nr:Ig-like domain-containing protein [Bacillus ndiopicus]